MFAAELSKRELIPAIDNQGALVFVGTEDGITVDPDLLEVLSVSELARLSGSNVVSPDLSEIARGRLTGYIRTFGPSEFKDSVEGLGWASQIHAFSEGVVSRQGRRQLAMILAYLQRNWLEYPGDLGKCTIVLTQDGRLRAADEKDARKVYTFPDDDIRFSPEELRNHYDAVHGRFRGELNRPGAMTLDHDITRDAVKTLLRVAP